METYLLKWDVSEWTAARHERAMARVIEEGFCDAAWGGALDVTPRVGARVFFMRQAPEGIIGSGAVLSAPRAGCVTVRINALYDAPAMLPREALNAPGLKHPCWDAAAPCVRIPGAIAVPLERAWAALVSDARADGAALAHYEQDKRLRRACLERHGHACAACQMSFLEAYGVDIARFVRVAHDAPARVDEPAEVDPERDLRPVCPNCYAVIHSRSPPHSVEDVRRMLRR